MFEMNEDAKMHCKQAYKCGICNKEYHSVQERMNCEMKCVKKQEEEKKKAAEAKKNAEKPARKKEVEDAIDNAHKLLKKYINDYGYADIELPINEFQGPSKLWHYFF